MVARRVLTSLARFALFSDRHELIVLSEAPRVLSVDACFVAVAKPPTLPCHTTGLYSKNTVLEMLERERDRVWALRGAGGGEGGAAATDLDLGDRGEKWHLLYRLDRLVSGLLVLSRGPQLAGAMQRLMKANRVDKFYVACVRGDFPCDSAARPDGVVVADFPLGYDSDAHLAFTEADLRAEEAAAQEQEDPEDPEGQQGRRRRRRDRGQLKASRTLFKRLDSRGSFSAVLCMPVTGRTHQIRAHLKALGHPILNDGAYGGAGAMPSEAEGFSHALAVADEEAMRMLAGLKVADFGWEDKSSFCVHCPHVTPTRYAPKFDSIYLHCWRYQISEEAALEELFRSATAAARDGGGGGSHGGGGAGHKDKRRRKAWEYECPLPRWAAHLETAPGADLSAQCDLLRRAKKALCGEPALA